MWSDCNEMPYDNRGVATIRNKIVETLSSNGVISKSKTIHTFPPSYPFKVGVFAVCYKGTWTAAQCCKEGVGKGKLYFPLFKIYGKMRERERNWVMEPKTKQNKRIVSTWEINDGRSLQGPKSNNCLIFMCITLL